MESRASSHLQDSIESRSFYSRSETEYTLRSVAQRKQDASLDNASREFNYHWIGPMKTDRFILEYLAKDPLQLQDRKQDDEKFQRLNQVVDGEYRLENKLYNDLSLSLSACFEGTFSFECTGSKTSANDRDFYPNITVCTDALGEPPPRKAKVGPGEVGEVACQWESPRTVMNVEIKNALNREGFAIDLLKDPSKQDQAFVLYPVDPQEVSDTESNYSEHRKTRGQLVTQMKYLMNCQPRTRVFSCLIARTTKGLYARFIMADRSAAVVTEELPLFETDGIQMFLKFFDSLYANLAAKDDRAAQLRCGYDPTLRTATKEEATTLMQALEQRADFFSHWSLDTSRVIRIEGPPNRSEAKGDPSVYICLGKPVNHNPAFLSRGTRCYVGINAETKDLVFIKDSWRFEVPSILPEWQVYETLSEDPAAQGIPRVESSGDLPGHVTVSIDADAKDKETRRRLTDSTIPPQHNVDDFGNPEISEKKYVKLTKLQHYRIIFKTIARPLTSWKNSYHLVKILRVVIQAHSDAYKKKLLHRDVSVGNIFIDGDDCGLLGDWDLNAPTQKGCPRRFHRTGTWQFISAMLLLNPTGLYVSTPYEHSLIDDLESFFWVLLYQVMQYLRLERLTDNTLSQWAAKIFDSTTSFSGQVYGGEAKGFWLNAGSPTFKPVHNPPLWELIGKLCTYFV